MAIVGVALTTYFNHFYFVPTLTYEQFQPYRYSEREQVTMLVVANEGRNVATKVLVKVETVGEIKSFRLESPEAVEATKEGNNLLVVRAERLTGGTQIAIYVIEGISERKPTISVTSDQTRGQEKKGQAGPDPSVVYVSAGAAFILLINNIRLSEKLTRVRQTFVVTRKNYESVQDQLQRAQAKLRESKEERSRLKMQIHELAMRLSKGRVEWEKKEGV